MSPETAEPRPSGGRRLRQLANLSVAELRGVGPRKVASLELMGIRSVLDLLTHYPRRYADRTNSTAIDAVAIGEEAVISAQIQRVAVRRPRGRKPIVELALDDGTGKLSVSFFNQPWRSHQLAAEMNVVVFGKVDWYRDHLQMVNPLVDLVGDQTGRIVPIYPQSGKAGVGSSELADYVREALERAGEFADPLPAGHREALGLIKRTDAFRHIHAPEEFTDRDRARRRLAFDELFRLQLALVLRKRAAAMEARGIEHVTAAEGPLDLVGAFLSNLPFQPTLAQRRVIDEIAADLASPLPMHRLLQGDVGAGKTIVALAALLYGVQGGYQGALMVPTEVLAEQHFLASKRLLDGVTRPDASRLMGSRPVSVALLTSKTPGAQRSRLISQLRQGSIDLLVGTHALITEEVRFANLGVVVIDEQHRFGVDQRAALREKGSADEATGHDPDLLVMTATPIPRTAAMTVYGDLDYSVLDEMPPGRKPVRTVWIHTEAEEAGVWSHVKSEVEAGRQAFVVCPFIAPGEEADDGAVDRDDPDGKLFDEGEPARPPRAAVTEFERLRTGELSGLAIGLLHGQLPPKEKEKVMNDFRSGVVSVLVATTVIEVGVDIPQATVMVIEDAERFGIAQLHQLRGRVGRGGDPSVCFLLGDPTTDSGIARLGALEATNDGFELAEVDLELRGEGTVLGARQRGRSDLRLASLRRDRDLIVAARSVAEAIVAEDPTLAAHGLLADELLLFSDEEDSEYLFRS